MSGSFRFHSADLETLLAETGWLHGVASGLGYHAQAADDAVQETLLAALQFEGGEPGRGWLRKVLRRQIGMDQRANARRRARERLVARAERDDLDPSLALESIELNARLRRAVAELPRKEREVIALRFGAGLGPAEIAETLNESANAVSSRLSRGLRKLRRALDDEAGPRDRAHAFGLFSLFTAALMKKNLALFVILVIVAGLVPLGLRALQRDGSSATIQEALEPELVAVAAHGKEQSLAGPVAGASAEREIATHVATSEIVAVEEDAAVLPAKGSVRIRVVEALTGLPAKGVALDLVEFHGGAFWDQTLRGSTDQNGLLEFDQLSPGPRVAYLNRVDPHGDFAAETLEVIAGDVAEVTFEVDAASVVRGRVVNEAGAAVPRARIWVGSGMGGVDHGQIVTLADEGGEFEVKYIGRTQFLSASAPGRAPSPSAASGIGQPFDENGRLLLIVGSRRGTVRGTVTDAAGVALPGATVTLGGLERPESTGTEPISYWSPPMRIERTDEFGAFEFVDASIGEVPLQARIAGSGLWAQTVLITDGGVLEVPIRLIPGGTVKGQVLDASGEPCPRATVSVHPSIHGALSRMETVSAEDGRFELRGVTPGRVEFQVQDDRWTRILRHHVLVTSGQITTWNPVLPERKELRGRVLSESGEPLAHWGVATNPVVNGVVSPVGTGARTRADGSFALFQDYGDLFQIRINAPGGYARPVLTLGPMEIPNEEQTYVISDDQIPSAGAFGRVVDVEGMGVRATLDVSVGGPDPRSFEVRTAADGTFQIDYLSATAFELSVLAEGLPKHEVASSSPLVEHEIRDLGDIVVGPD
ncbi:RNA polymerase sigma factor [Planctomycetes bacterium Poly30]|uniref:RNA polymerase sigma factor n=1 Tax=Saltatorellus ferox TaxID=2528018 RepID=A0A518EUT1_9BACT|nr:RNA polymerase sigma factor [Planctomycetes bacterium Poly30]